MSHHSQFASRQTNKQKKTRSAADPNGPMLFPQYRRLWAARVVNRDTFRHHWSRVDDRLSAAGKRADGILGFPRAANRGVHPEYTGSLKTAL